MQTNSLALGRIMLCGVDSAASLPSSPGLDVTQSMCNQPSAMLDSAVANETQNGQKFVSPRECVHDDFDTPDLDLFDFGSPINGLDSPYDSGYYTSTSYDYTSVLPPIDHGFLDHDEEYPQPLPLQNSAVVVTSPAAAAIVSSAESSFEHIISSALDEAMPDTLLNLPIRPPHKRIHKSKARSKSQIVTKDRHSCSVSSCDRTFSRPSDMLRHVRDVHGQSGKRFSCNTCPHSSRRKDKVKEHCQKQHNNLRGLELMTECDEVVH